MMRVYPVKLLNREDTGNLINEIGVEFAALPMLTSKAVHLNIKIKSIKSSWANIIKQEMLSCGGDAAINKASYCCKVEKTDVLLMGSESTLKNFISKMKTQPPCFKPIVDSLEELINKKGIEIKLGGKTFDVARDFIVIGVLNVTPDSFSDGGKYNSYDLAMSGVEELLASGADVVDVGGESTRPGSARISSQEEIDRVIPIIDAINRNFDTVISIDSYKPEVIKSALCAGAKLVNDVSSGSAVLKLTDEIIKNQAAALIMMNLTGDGIWGSTPDVGLKDPVEEFFDFAYKKRSELEEAGIPRDSIIFDPGVGFGLSTNDINRIFKRAASITGSGIPLCMGLSRKSYIGRLTNLKVDERDGTGNAISLFLMTQGVRIFRTHDPRGLNHVIRFYKSMERG